MKKTISVLLSSFLIFSSMLMLVSCAGLSFDTEVDHTETSYGILVTDEFDLPCIREVPKTIAELRYVKHYNKNNQLLYIDVYQLASAGSISDSIGYCDRIEYNSKGAIVSSFDLTRTYGEDGKLQKVESASRTMTLAYSEDDRSVIGTISDLNGTFIGTITVEYDAMGRIISEEILMENPLDPWSGDIKNTYAYNDSGACIQIERYCYGELTNREQFEYTNGLLTKESWEAFSLPGSCGEYSTYQYDANGTLIREDSYDIDGTWESYILHEQIGDNRTEKHFLPDGTLTQTSVYNSEGALIRTSGDSEDTEYVYNANGLLIRFRNHEQTVEYEYDTNEQLVKCTIKNDDTAVIWFDFVYDEKQACTAISAQNVVGDIQLTVEKKDNQSIVISPSGTVYFEITNRTSSYTGMDSVGDTIISYTFYPTGALHFYEESEYTEEYRTDPKDGKVHILYGWEYIRKKTFSPTGELLKSIGYDE